MVICLVAIKSFTVSVIYVRLYASVSVFDCDVSIFGVMICLLRQLSSAVVYEGMFASIIDLYCTVYVWIMSFR